MRWKCRKSTFIFKCWVRYARKEKEDANGPNDKPKSNDDDNPPAIQSCKEVIEDSKSEEVAAPGSASREASVDLEY